MSGAQRIDEIIALLQAFVLGETNLSKRQVKAGLKLLDLAVGDAPPPDGGDEVPVLADEPTAPVFRPKYLI